MSIHELIKQNLAAALKGGSKERAGALRLLLSELYNKQKEKFGGNLQPLADEDALAVLQREAKKRREAIELFKNGKREDLAKKDEMELRVIEEFLPKQLSRDEIKKIVDDLKEKGFSDFNSLMKEAMKELRGRADGRAVSEVVKEELK
jgi:hypothetical protein